ncbi:hypothetical protein K3495_g7564 [Podosphaera aphanis]|nr:hypothetical protein K3495_g7564 [Podosphaera aphanis]
MKSSSLGFKSNQAAASDWNNISTARKNSNGVSGTRALSRSYSNFANHRLASFFPSYSPTFDRSTRLENSSLAEIFLSVTDSSQKFSINVVISSESILASALKIISQHECTLQTDLKKQFEENKQQTQENKLLLTQRISQLETENQDLRTQLSAPSNSQKISPTDNPTAGQNTANIACNVADKTAATLISVARSPPHPDPGPFTGEKRELLPGFLKQFKLKLRQNNDRWLTEQKRMGYVLSQLCGPAIAQFDDQNEDGLINFTGVDAMINHLRIALRVLDD